MSQPNNNRFANPFNQLKGELADSYEGMVRLMFGNDYLDYNVPDPKKERNKIFKYPRATLERGFNSLKSTTNDWIDYLFPSLKALPYDLDLNQQLHDKGLSLTSGVLSTAMAGYGLYKLFDVLKNYYHSEYQYF